MHVSSGCLINEPDSYYYVGVIQIIVVAPFLRVCGPCICTYIHSHSERGKRVIIERFQSTMWYFHSVTPTNYGAIKFCGWNINNPFGGLLEEKRWLTLCLLQNLDGSITSAILRITPRVPNYCLRDEFGEFYSFRCGIASCERERERERGYQSSNTQPGT